MQRPNENSETTPKPQGGTAPEPEANSAADLVSAARMSAAQRTAETAETTGEEPAEVDENPECLGMAKSVTRHAHFSEPEKWKFLVCGIDTLDLGLRVSWGETFGDLANEWNRFREQAEGTQGVRWGELNCLVHSRGKPPMYRWHLQWPEFHLWIGISEEPSSKTPNVYVSINAETLWKNGVPAAVAMVTAIVEGLGGTVLTVVPSRCDIAADFLIPGGISLPFLQALQVPRHRHGSHEGAPDSLETYYVGAKSSPIRLRVYDKGEEVQKGGTKFWFLNVWLIDQPNDVWRVEFQLRRPFLREQQIGTVGDLIHKVGDLWAYLTKEWVSFRNRDNPNPSRRSVHVWWQAVTQSSGLLGDASNIQRGRIDEPADSSWYVSHIAGCMAGFSARIGCADFEESLLQLTQRLRRHWKDRGFADRVNEKLIRMGCQPEPRQTGREAA